ncbi:MAG: dihydroorotate dehydrogenase electron transfer subunit [Clostridiales bacterium]|nr:dihydroorotate dehydrogenase electron transfer subunit [Clostridiales bacterium]
MKKTTYLCEILELSALTEDIFQVTIDVSSFKEKPLPGQFLNIKCGLGLEAFLRRPISIYDFDPIKDELNFVFQIRGKGTAILAKTKKGDLLDIMGPLGTNFYISDKKCNIAVVGGGIGIFPLYYLMKESRLTKNRCYLGFRSKDAVILEDEFAAVSDLTVSTDDGSYGKKGFVTELLAAELKSGYRPDIIYTCGPEPMMMGVVKLAEQYGIKCQLSLEGRMGCGIGACLVCACRLKGGEYGHVCKDGPVMWSGSLEAQG